MVALVQVVDDGCFVEVSELGHVVGFVEFSGIDLVDGLGVHFALLGGR